MQEDPDLVLNREVQGDPDLVINREDLEDLEVLEEVIEEVLKDPEEVLEEVLKDPEEVLEEVLKEEIIDVEVEEVLDDPEDSRGGGPDPNATDGYGMTGLYRAAANNEIDNMAALVTAGANIDYADHHGGTALIVATINGHTEAIKWLLHNGANNIRSKTRKTALDYAKKRLQGEMGSIGADQQEVVDALEIWEQTHLAQ